MEKQRFFDYRLVKLTYFSREESEDGPGSLTNIVTSDPSIEVIASWQNKEESFLQELLDGNHLPRVCMPSWSEDSWVDHSFRLDQKPVGDDSWEFAGHFSPNCISESSYYEEREYDEYDEAYEQELEEEYYRDLCEDCATKRCLELDQNYQQIYQKYLELRGKEWEQNSLISDLKMLTGAHQNLEKKHSFLKDLYNDLEQQYESLRDILFAEYQRYQDLDQAHTKLQDDYYELHLKLESKFWRRLINRVKNIFSHK